MEEKIVVRFKNLKHCPESMNRGTIEELLYSPDDKVIGAIVRWNDAPETSIESLENIEEVKE